MPSDVLIFSPLPPVPSGIAHYSHALAEQLLRRLGCRVTLVVNQKRVSYSHNYDIRHWKDFLYNPLPNDAVPIYQLGNSVYHEYIYPFLFSDPGIVVLHDFILGHGRLRLLIQSCTSEERRNELVHQLGTKAGEYLSHVIDNGVHGDQLPFAARLNRATLEASLVTVVHNPDTEYLIRQEYPHVPVTYFPMGMWETEPRKRVIDEDIQSLKKKHGIEPDSLVLGTFGVVNPYKQIDVQLQAVKELYEAGYRICLLIAGFIDRKIDIYQQITDPALQNFVKIIENPTKREYWDLVRLSDVCFSLRFPPVGEFSLSVLELMASGRPVVINKHRYNAFIPEDVCVKIQNVKQKEDLIAKTAHLYSNPDIRKDIGNRAREYTENNFSMAKMLKGYFGVIESYKRNRSSWKDPRPSLPWHLRPLHQRVAQQTMERFIQPVPEFLLKEIEQAFAQKLGSSQTTTQPIPALTSR